MSLVFWQYFWEIEVAFLLLVFILFTFFVELRASAVSSLCLMIFFSSLLFLNLLDFNFLNTIDSSILINNNLYFFVFNFIFLFISIYFWQIFFSRSNSKMEFGTLFFFIFFLGLCIFKIKDFLEAFLIIESLSFIAYILAGFEKNTKTAASVGIQYLIIGSISSIFLILSLLLVYYQFSTVSLLNLSILDLDFLSTNFYKISNNIFFSNLEEKKISFFNFQKITALNIFESDISYGSYDFFINNNQIAFYKDSLEGSYKTEELYIDLFTNSVNDNNLDMIKQVLVENLKLNSFFDSSNIITFSVLVVGSDKSIKLIENTSGDFFNINDSESLQDEFLQDLIVQESLSKPVIGSLKEISNKNVVSINSLESEFFNDLIESEFCEQNKSFDNFFFDWIGTYDFIFVDSFIFGVLVVSLGFLMGTLLYKIKGAPFHIWAPTIYTRMPTSSMVILITTFTLIFSLYFFQLFFSIFFMYEILFSQIFLVAGLLSLIFGFLGAFDQKILKKFFVFSSIGHVAFLLFTFITQSTFKNGTLLLVYLLIYILSTILLWYLITFNNLKIDFLSNLLKKIKTNNFFYFIFIIIVFSMSGIPPLAGFYVKFDVLSILMNSNEFFILFLSLLITVASFYYYLRLLKISTFENFEPISFVFLNIEKLWQFIRLSFLFFFIPLLLCFPLVFEQSFFYIFSYSNLY